MLLNTEKQPETFIVLLFLLMVLGFIIFVESRMMLLFKGVNSSFSACEKIQNFMATLFVICLALCKVLWCYVAAKGYYLKKGN